MRKKAVHLYIHALIYMFLMKKDYFGIPNDNVCE